MDNAISLAKGSHKSPAMHGQPSKREITRLKTEFARVDLDAREFFFRKAVVAYLDEKLQLEHLAYSMEGVFPAMSKQEIRDFLNKLEIDKVGLNGSRDFYMDKVWENFTLAGKTHRPAPSL